MTIATLPGPKFDDLATAGERLVFVLTARGKLVVAPQVHGSFEVRHPVVAGGQPVRAAGELDLLQAGDTKIVLRLNNRSGHYQPGPECLAEVVSLLKSAGFDVPVDVVDLFPGD